MYHTGRASGPGIFFLPQQSCFSRPRPFSLRLAGTVAETAGSCLAAEKESGIRVQAGQPQEREQDPFVRSPERFQESGPQRLYLRPAALLQRGSLLYVFLYILSYHIGLLPFLPAESVRKGSFDRRPLSGEIRIPLQSCLEISDGAPALYGRGLPEEVLS